MAAHEPKPPFLLEPLEAARSLSPEIVEAVFARQVGYEGLGEERLREILYERDIENAQLQQQREQLAHDATHDLLTGVFNRRGFTEQFSLAAARRRRLGETYSPDIFAKFDLDKFKQVNDKHGHDAGDETLQQMSTIIPQFFGRETDVLGRIGGDEFNVLLIGQSMEDAVKQFTELLGWLKVFHDMGQTQPDPDAWPRITEASIGIAPIDGTQTYEEIDKMTDVALYKAKESGRGQIVVIEQPAATT